MCIFNKKVSKVNGTKIFVSKTSDGRQLTIYQNYVDIFFDPSSGGRENKALLEKAHREQKEIENRSKSASSTDSNAMILPFPSTSGDESQVTLIDLSQYKNLFVDCNSVFPVLKVQTEGRQRQLAPSQQKVAHLVVHSVGSYNVSIAMNLEDLQRYDPNVFQLSPNVGEILGHHYPHSFGFLICGFKECGEKHPLGYIHSLLPDIGGETEEKEEKKGKRDRLFVPTLHEHGGEGEENSADWDHEIFSVNTVDSHSAGVSVQEKWAQLLALDDVVSGLKRGVVTLRVEELLEKIPVKLVKVESFRKLEKKGKGKNEDLIFVEETRSLEGIIPKKK